MTPTRDELPHPHEIYRVEPSEDRIRLDRFVEGRMPAVSRGRIRRAILGGEVTVNGTHRESGRKLAAGDTVEFRAAAPVIASMSPEEIPLPVLYEDEALLVVDKPTGMLAHPTSRVHAGTVLNAAAWYLNRDGTREQPLRPLLVHRLDQATSGALVISKSLEAHATLATAFGDRRVTKIYLALVCGRFASAEGMIDAPIGGSRDRMPGFAVDESGKPAQTTFRLVREYGPYSLLELRPLTGRTNQLRIHCDHAGAPIAGDDLHGLARIEAFRAENPDAAYPSRLFLHAASIEFPHPETGATTHVEAPLPDDLDTLLSRLAAT